MCLYTVCFINWWLPDLSIIGKKRYLSWITVFLTLKPIHIRYIQLMKERQIYVENVALLIPDENHQRWVFWSTCLISPTMDFERIDETNHKHWRLKTLRTTRIIMCYLSNFSLYDMEISESLRELRENISNRTFLRFSNQIIQIVEISKFRRR